MARTRACTWPPSSAPAWPRPCSCTTSASNIRDNEKWRAWPVTPGPPLQGEPVVRVGWRFGVLAGTCGFPQDSLLRPGDQRGGEGRSQNEAEEKADAARRRDLDQGSHGPSSVRGVHLGISKWEGAEVQCGVSMISFFDGLEGGVCVGSSRWRQPTGSTSV